MTDDLRYHCSGEANNYCSSLNKQLLLQHAVSMMQMFKVRFHGKPILHAMFCIIFKLLKYLTRGGIKFLKKRQKADK